MGWGPRDPMKPTGYLRKGDGFALIDMLFVCGIIGIISTIALPSLLLARQSAGAASAIGSMRVINSSQLTFALTCGGGFYAPNLTTLGTPTLGSNESFISPNLGVADVITKSGYTIEVSATPYPGSPQTCNGFAPGQMGQGYKAGADSLDVENRRFFGMNANGVIWEHDSSIFGGMPEMGDSPAGHHLR
jgi:type IV pilus assembly protein PilA